MQPDDLAMGLIVVAVVALGFALAAIVIAT